MEELKSNLGMPIAVVVAAVIIGGAIMFTNKDNDKKIFKDADSTPTVENNQATSEASKISPVTSEDHIRGDINAKIKIVEYSDTECPFCKRLHQTLTQISKEYGSDVAWVYRHMPLAQLHSKAFGEAVATECVAELGGEEKFWSYIDRIYATSPGNDQFDQTLLPQYAVELGIDKTKFETCVASGKYDAQINAQIEEGFAAGGEGTPFNVIITPDGEFIPLAGAYPIETWRSVIDSILKK